jgi:hypothetical protein
MNDPIVRVVVGLLCLVACAVLIWLPFRSSRRERGNAERFARQNFEPRGFSVEAFGGIEWDVVARGQVDGHTVIIRWAYFGHIQGARKEYWTEVSVAAPALPAVFGLAVGPRGVLKERNPAYPLVTNDPEFDSNFLGWTDHPPLASQLLTPEVRRGLFELRGIPELKLSALTAEYRLPDEYRPEQAVSIIVRSRGFDTGQIDQLTRVAIGFADASARVFGSIESGRARR